MQKYWNTVQDEHGNPRYGASVSVQQSGVNSTIYADSAGVATATNPIVTDATRGYFEFFAPAGAYDLVVTGVGFASYTITGGAEIGIREMVSVADFPTPQAAITASYGRILFWPKGTYTITSGLTGAGSNYVHWMGEHNRQTIIRYTGGASPIVTLEAATAPQIENISIENVGTATIAIQCNSLFARFRDLWISPTVAFTTAMILSRTDDVIENWTLRDCYFGGSNGARSAIGLLVNQGNNVVIDHCEFDDVQVGAQLGNTNFGGFASGLIRSCSVVNSFFQQQSTNATAPIGLDLYNVKGFNVAGNYFCQGNTNHLGIKCRSAKGGPITGNFFDGVGLSLYGIECADANSVNVSIRDNYFYRIVTAGALISAGTNIWTDNNTLETCPAQASQSNNSWTPVLKFGNSAVGITYAANGQVGRYFRRGNTMFIEFSISLSNKGAQVGSATITGLPKAATDITNALGSIPLFMDGMATLSGTQIGWFNNSETQIRLYQTNTGTAAALTDANFGNASVVWGSATYQVVDT